MSLEQIIKQITLNNLTKAYKFIIVKSNGKYYLYSDLESHHKDMFKNFVEIANKNKDYSDFKCVGGGLVLVLSKKKKIKLYKKELMLYGMSNNFRKFPKEIAEEIILDYIKDSEFKDYKIIVE